MNLKKKTAPGRRPVNGVFLLGCLIVGFMCVVAAFPHWFTSIDPTAYGP